MNITDKIKNEELEKDREKLRMYKCQKEIKETFDRRLDELRTEFLGSYCDGGYEFNAQELQLIYKVFEFIKSSNKNI